MTLLDELKTSLAEGLRRKSSTKCSTWTQNYVQLGPPVAGPLRFDTHPWSKEIHDCDSDWIAMKAAQMAMTQSAIDRCLFIVDLFRIGVSYYLPKRNPDAADFSRTKFDTILEYSPYIKAMFSRTKNVGHKQAGTVDFFIRGSKSRSGMKSISTGIQVFDEYDEMNIRQVILGEERKSGYRTDQKQTMKISTPTIPNFGIHDEFLRSKQMQYCFICPNCSRWTELTFPECLVITAESSNDSVNLKKSHLICKECKGILPHEAKKEFLGLRNAKWVPMINLDSDIPGYQIDQLYSIVMEPWEYARAALRAHEDSTLRQEFENSKRGLPHIEDGAKVSIEQIQARMREYSIHDKPPSGLITMGVDVGPHDIYFQIDQWLLPPILGANINLNATKKVLTAGVVHSFPNLDLLMQEYQILHCVVDVNPEYQSAISFAYRFNGHVTLCRFVEGINKNDVQPEANDLKTIQVNRTAWLDISQGRFSRHRGIFLPKDISELYKGHIQNLTKIRREDKKGNLISRYIKTGGEKTGKSDHFAFANVYSEMALPLALSRQENQDIRNYL